jgi:hypothetical protein
MSDEMADITNWVSDQQSLTASAVIRQALNFYFTQLGLLKPKQLPAQHRPAIEQPRGMVG